MRQYKSSTVRIMNAFAKQIGGLTRKSVIAPQAAVQIMCSNASRYADPCLLIVADLCALVELMWKWRRCLKSVQRFVLQLDMGTWR